MIGGPGGASRSISPLPPAAFAAALAALPGAGPAWLVGVLLPGGLPQDPERAWREVMAGRLAPPRPRWGRQGRRGVSSRETMAASRSVPGALVMQPADYGQPPPSPDFPSQIWRRCEAGHIGATWIGAPDYPAVLAAGPAPPGVLFWTGDLAVLGRPCVAVVGTRRCTPDGLEVAYALGYDLSVAGVAVVSGLAAGIDGAAHAGALAAVEQGGPAAGSTVGVAASGVDVPYPPKHAALWREVARRGAVISESPPGQPAQSWRFPSRNRVIAGLSRVVVVVESHAKGGSWHTVEAALQRGVEVAAVPGSVLSSASAGTNLLLREGALPVRNADDVLQALGLRGVGVSSVTQPSLPALPASKDGAGAQEAATRAPGPDGTFAAGDGDEWPGSLGPVERTVHQALGRRPQTVDQLVERSGLPLGAVLVALDRLDQRGAAAHSAGWWTRTYWH
jgi:DNA processing protein